MSVELWFIGVAFCLAAATSAAQAMARRGPVEAGLAVVMLVSLGISMSLSAWQGAPPRLLDLAAWCLALAIWPFAREGAMMVSRPKAPALADAIEGWRPGWSPACCLGLLAVGTMAPECLAEQVSLWGRMTVAAWLIGAVWGQASRRLDAAWAGDLCRALWGLGWRRAQPRWGWKLRPRCRLGRAGAWALCLAWAWACGGCSICAPSWRPGTADGPADQAHVPGMPGDRRQSSNVMALSVTVTG